MVSCVKLCYEEVNSATDMKGTEKTTGASSMKP
jgi:hypothetical protein